MVEVEDVQTLNITFFIITSHCCVTCMWSSNQLYSGQGSPQADQTPSRPSSTFGSANQPGLPGTARQGRRQRERTRLAYVGFTWLYAIVCVFF